MKTWLVNKHGSPDKVMNMGERSLPDISAGQIHIKVAAVGIGLPDVMMCRGTYAYSPPFPFTPGQEVVGTVLAIGEGVSAKVGDRVATVTAFYDGYGGFAEHAIAVGDETLFQVPDMMADAEAATFIIPYHTAWIGLVTRAQLQAKETLLVLGGSGGSGSAAIQLGRALGAKVIAVAGGAEKAESCKSFGAHEVIDHTQTDFVDEVKRLTAGQGANVIYDPVGGESFTRALGCIAMEGRILPIGFASGSWGQADTQLLVIKNCSVVGTIANLNDRQRMLDIHQQLLSLYGAGKIRSIVDHTVPFEQIPSALVDLEARRVKGKVVAVM